MRRIGAAPGDTDREITELGSVANNTELEIPTLNPARRRPRQASYGSAGNQAIFGEKTRPDSERS